MKRRVSAPVTGLKRIPSAMPATSSVEARCDDRSRRPWSRSPALLQVLDRLAELVADVVVRRNAACDDIGLSRSVARSPYSSRAVAKARSTSLRSFSSLIARSTYGRTGSAFVLIVLFPSA